MDVSLGAKHHGFEEVFKLTDHISVSDPTFSKAHSVRRGYDECVVGIHSKAITIVRSGVSSKGAMKVLVRDKFPFEASKETCKMKD